jgi:putative transposase
MPEYKRYFLQGGTYFFTVVTFQRRCIFDKESTISLLRNSFKTTMEFANFSIDAIVILPDHIHTIWTLPEEDSDFSTRWKLIKSTFSKQFNNTFTDSLPDSIISKGESGIWQRRFWEHLIRDQEDFNKHCDYIHYNPVKHGFVKSPSQWKFSSFSKFLNQGIYEENWGSDIDNNIVEMDFE